MHQDLVRATRRVALQVGSAGMLAAACATMTAPALAAAPLGYQLMCLKTPAECRGGGAESVEASADMMAVLKKVNAQVNRAITPRNDGGADVWNASATSGDCEDYVLAKRRALIKAGLPASALRIAYVKTRAGIGHAVLVVKTSRGDYALDNLTQTIKPLSQTGYRLISISGADPMQWS